MTRNRYEASRITNSHQKFNFNGSKILNAIKIHHPTDVYNAIKSIFTFRFFSTYFPFSKSNISNKPDVLLDVVGVFMFSNKRINARFYEKVTQIDFSTSKTKKKKIKTFTSNAEKKLNFIDWMCISSEIPLQKFVIFDNSPNNNGCTLWMNSSDWLTNFFCFFTSSFCLFLSFDLFTMCGVILVMLPIYLLTLEFVKKLCNKQLR